uniref:Exocyst complex component 7 n=1 Tax=Cacopsylla melanoneura TaxID=428564 RepID=A0A8D8LKU4_9HEMI
MGTMDALYCEDKKAESYLKHEKEAQNLALFKEKIKRSKQITENMVGILSSFENRLSKLEDSIVPIYNETGNLQRRQSNIDHTLSYLDHVIGFYSICTDVESIIRSGPAGPKGLDTFLATMTKLNQAQNYFEKNNPQSVELENVNTLFNTGVDSLNREFKDLLLKHSKPVQPIQLLDLIAADDELSSIDATSSHSNSASMNDTNESGSLTSLSNLTNFPEPVTSDLNKMCDWLIQHSRDEFMNVYARIRSNVLVKSLKLLKHHHKSNSGSSMQGSSSPQPKTKFRHHESSSTTRKIQSLVEKKANKMLMKASQTLESSTGIQLGARKSSLFDHREDDIVDESEMENYLVSVMSLQRLMMTEKSLMSSLIIEKHRGPLFQIIIQGALDSTVQDGESIAAKAKRCIARHDFQAVLVIFPILKHLTLMKPDFERAVEGCDLNIRNQFSNILNTLHATGAKALEDFIDRIRTDSTSSLPPDGTVHQLTSDVLVFVQQLLEYTETIASVLAQDVSYVNSVNLDQTKPTDRNKILLGIYIKKILSQLNLTLINKSELYSDHGVKCLFRINNCNYILKALQRSTGLANIVTSCENTYYEMINTHKTSYQQCWARVMSYITGLDSDLQVVSGKLRDKDKNALKERFSNFNKEMEDISRTQRGYSIPDVELRESIKRDNKEYILPKYRAFYDRYSTLPFSKNPEKYVKYTPEQIAALLDRFFDVAA